MHPLPVATALLALVAAGCAGAAPDSPEAAAPPARAERLRDLRHELRILERSGDFGRGEFARAAPSPAPPGVLLQPGAGAEASYETGVVVARQPFFDALVSFNAACPPGRALCVELRVRDAASGAWSPYLHVADWAGDLAGPEGPVTAFPEGLVTAFEGGRVDVDFFRGEREFDAARLRVRARVTAEPRAGGEGTVVLRRLALCLTGAGAREAEDDARGRARGPEDGPRTAARPGRLAVPFRSQRAEAPELADRICSPTSVAMVLAYRGVERPTAEVAARAYDARHDIYGNWPRAVQAAYEYGVPGYLRRFGAWAEVERAIADGQPLIASIRVGEGELSGAPYRSTAGHLIVITGFDERGDVLVNDPAAPTEAAGRATYLRRELDRVWLANGGVAYVLLPREDA